ncbi:MAG: tagatose 1,6-diphosphate aldolase [Candidatus Limnocylindrales bacterium]
MRLGTLRGLDACASDKGTFSVLALDHRNNLRRALAPDDPGSVSYERLVAIKRSIVRAVAPVADGILLDPELGAGPAVHDGSLPSGCGLMVAVEESGYEGPSTERTSRLMRGWGVGQVKRMGGDAVKLLLYYHPDAANADEQERLLIEVAEQCADLDIPLFLETLTYPVDPGVDKLTDDARREAVIRSAHRLTALGGDVYKCEFPYDAGVTDKARWAEACAELEEASAIPWVILSAGVDEATFEAQTLAACEAGASGVLVGRSVWKEGAHMEAPERDTWLADVGVARMRRLVDIVEAEAVPWRERSPLAQEPGPTEGWAAGYPGDPG